MRALRKKCEGRDVVRKKRKRRMWDIDKEKNQNVITKII